MDQININIDKERIANKLKEHGTPDHFTINHNSVGSLCIEMLDFFDIRTGVDDTKTLSGYMFGKKVIWDDTLSNNRIKFIYPSKHKKVNNKLEQKKKEWFDKRYISIEDRLMNISKQQVINVMYDAFKIMRQYTNENTVTDCLVQAIEDNDLSSILEETSYENL